MQQEAGNMKQEAVKKEECYFLEENARVSWEHFYDIEDSDDMDEGCPVSKHKHL